MDVGMDIIPEIGMQTAIGVVIGDPATGIVRISEAEFRQNWSGNLLLLRPIELS